MARRPAHDRSNDTDAPEDETTPDTLPDTAAMLRADGSRATGGDATTTGFPWGPAARLVVTLVLLAGTVALLIAGQHWSLALLILLGLRLPTELLLATQRVHSNGRQAAHLLSCATWAYLPIGITWIVHHDPPFPVALWLLGLSLLTGGLALLAHHERENTRRPGAGRILGPPGIISASLGAGLAITEPLAGSGLEVVLPLAVSIAVLLLLVLLRPRADPPDTGRPPDARDWLRHHRLRLLFVLLPVAAYLFTRDLLATQDLLFPLWAWEFVGAVAFVSFLLWAVRAQLRPLLTDDPLQSPHHRHEPSITRHSEPGFDEWESVVDAFLRRGDKSGVNRLLQELERTDRVPATQAFSGLLNLRTRSFILLVHPAWLYVADLLALLAVTLLAHHHAGRIETLLPVPQGADYPSLAAALAAAIGLYALQTNRHGGPWWIKTLSGHLGLLVFLLLAWGPLKQILLQSGVIVPASLLVPLLIVSGALPLMHAARARSHRPRHAYNGHDPAQALEQSGHGMKRLLIGRTAWIGGLALAVAAAALVLTRVHPSYELMIGAYTLIAAPLLIIPGITLLGFRLGRRRIQRITRRETDHRKEHLETALAQLEDAYRRQRDPRPRTPHRPPRGVP